MRTLEIVLSAIGIVRIGLIPCDVWRKLRFELPHAPTEVHEFLLCVRFTPTQLLMRASSRRFLLTPPVRVLAVSADDVRLES